MTFLIVAGVAAATFLWVLRNAGRPKAVDANAIGGLRKRFALTCFVLLGGALALTLPRLPYPRTGEVPDKVVFVAAKQFAFGMSETPVNTEQEWEVASQGPAIRVPARSLVEFRVSSLDVNHGFGIYTPGGTLMAQTQAMPGYANRLRVRFDEPGRYPVLCLELCGMEHHSMRAVFDVVQSDKEAKDGPSHR